MKTRKINIIFGANIQMRQIGDFQKHTNSARLFHCLNFDSTLTLIWKCLARQLENEILLSVRITVCRYGFVVVALKCVAPKIFLPVTPLWFVGNKSVIFAHDPVAFLLLSTLALMMSRILTPSSNPSAQFCTLKTQAEHYWGVVLKHILTDFIDQSKHNLISIT